MVDNAKSAYRMDEWTNPREVKVNAYLVEVSHYPLPSIFDKATLPP